MTIIRSIRANVYILIPCNEWDPITFHRKDFVAWCEYIYVSSYRPDDGHIIDRNM